MLLNVSCLSDNASKHLLNAVDSMHISQTDCCKGIWISTKETQLDYILNFKIQNVCPKSFKQIPLYETYSM